jgi:hypothetical protein
MKGHTLGSVEERSPQRRSDGCTEFGGLGWALLEDPVLCHEGVKLLLLVGNSWRQRCDVPMDVSIALHAAQGQNISSFGRNDLVDCAGNPVNNSL